MKIIKIKVDTFMEKVLRQALAHEIDHQQELKQVDIESCGKMLGQLKGK